MESETIRGQREVRVFLFLSALYFLSQFYRVSSAVIAPELIRELRLDPKECGLIGGAFFYSFTVLQIPLGPMLDQLGPRTLLLGAAMLASGGSLLFASARSFAEAFLGRLLIGAGMAPVLMGSLKYFSQSMPSARFARMTGLLYSIGISGNLLAASPLVLLTQAFGWRKTFVAFGLLTAVLGLGAFKVLRTGSAPAQERSRTQPEKGQWAQALLTVLRSMNFWKLACVAFFRYGTFVSLQGLWLATYFTYIKGFQPAVVGHLLLLMSLGAIIGGPIGGQLFSRSVGGSRRLIAAALTLNALCLFILTATAGTWAIRSPVFFGALLFSLGFLNGVTMMVYAQARESFPLAISGTAMSSVNFFTMAGGGVFMALLGWIVDLFGSGAESHVPAAYQCAFLTCAVGVLLSAMFYVMPLRWSERRSNAVQ